jgi:acyl-CoA thioesterase-1
MTVAVALAALWLQACAGDAGKTNAGAAPAAAPAAAPVAEVPARPRIVVLGDSLTAGYGLPSTDDAFPALLQRKIDREGLGFDVVNMGVSGDTSAGGLRRLDWALEGDVRVLVVALGANDGLRGLGPAQLRQNLEAMIDRARGRGVAVLLCGMEAPPNLGAQYTGEFRRVYSEVAREKGVAFLPFLLDGVAGVAELNQNDGIHPNHEGTARVADLVWTSLRPLLESSSS